MKPLGSSARTRVQTLPDLLADWRQLLDRCRRKPTRKRVHALRVVTLRIQVEFEHELSQLPRASHEAQAILRFSKLAAKLRSALALVRELDVSLGKLLRLRESMGRSTEYVPRSTRQMVRQIEQLEGRLAKRRQRASLKLVNKIGMRKEELLLASQGLEGAGGSRVAEGDDNYAAALVKEFATIATEFPVLEVGNLHEFRKKLKHIRYLAEIHRADPACQKIATQMKKAQTAIGDWHDWEALAMTTRRGKNRKGVEIADLFASIASEGAESAIEASHALLLRMADLQSEEHALAGGLRKPPVRSERPGHILDRKLA